MKRFFIRRGDDNNDNDIRVRNALLAQLGPTSSSGQARLPEQLPIAVVRCVPVIVFERAKTRHSRSRVRSPSLGKIQTEQYSHIGRCLSSPSYFWKVMVSRCPCTSAGLYCLSLSCHQESICEMYKLHTPKSEITRIHSIPSTTYSVDSRQWLHYLTMD